MSKTSATRITVMLDDNLIKKLRLKQAKLIQNASNSVSFSKVVNLELEKSLK